MDSYVNYAHTCKVELKRYIITIDACGKTKRYYGQDETFGLTASLNPHATFLLGVAKPGTYRQLKYPVLFRPKQKLEIRHKTIIISQLQIPLAVGRK